MSGYTRLEYKYLKYKYVGACGRLHKHPHKKQVVENHLEESPSILKIHKNVNPLTYVLNLILLAIKLCIGLLTIT